MKRRVVVTGVGLVSPLGIGVDETWQALCAGKSGIGEITRFDTSKFQTKIAGEVRNFNAEDFLPKKEAKRTERFISYAIAATRMAMEDSGLKVQEDKAHRVGVIVSSVIGGIECIDINAVANHTKGPRRISPFFIPGSIINIAPGQIAMRYGARGPNYSVVTACAAGTHSIGEAFRQIQWGHADAVIAGGAESAITELAIGGFCIMRALSTKRNDSPEKASRPFDMERDGFILAEGAGVMTLESLDHALERGAKIYAEVIGVGMSADAGHITAPNREGAKICLQVTLEDAGLKPEEVDYINAHGTSTPLNDACESQAIKDVFGEHAYKVPTSSTKSLTGHLLGAAGAVELIYCVQAIQNGIIPATINYENTDPECDLDYVPNEPRKADIKVAISNSFGFGGTNATLAIKKYEENGVQ